MPEYRFSLILHFTVLGKNVRPCPYTGKYESEKTRILEYFMLCILYFTFYTYDGVSFLIKL